MGNGLPWASSTKEVSAASSRIPLYIVSSLATSVDVKGKRRCRSCDTPWERASEGAVIPGPALATERSSAGLTDDHRSDRREREGAPPRRSARPCVGRWSLPQNKTLGAERKKKKRKKGVELQLTTNE